MASYSYDHIHLRTRDPKETAEWYRRMFGAEVLESVQSDGQPRIDLNLNGLTIFLARVPEQANIPSAPVEPYLGLDHFGLRVDNLDAAYAQLKERGATFTTEPRTIRPGVKIAFIQCPDNVRIELLERSAAG
jgi:catechol 2,3-dioxygenase-like lactoylglutathione lyase family enzyme